MESQHKLAKLLPATAFHSYNKDQTTARSLDKYHPSRRSTELEQNKFNGGQSGDKSATGEGTSHLPPEDDASGSENPGRAPDLDSMFFLDPHFQSAARTFQVLLFYLNLLSNIVFVSTQTLSFLDRTTYSPGG